MKNRNGKFTWSENDETFMNGVFDSIQECIGNAKMNADSEVIYIGTVNEPDINIEYFGDDIIDCISEQLYNEVGEVADTFNPTKKEKADLNKRISETVSKWLTDTNEPDCFKVSDIQEYNIKTGEKI